MRANITPLFKGSITQTEPGGRFDFIGKMRRVVIKGPQVRRWGAARTRGGYRQVTGKQVRPIRAGPTITERQEVTCLK